MVVLAAYPVQSFYGWARSVSSRFRNRKQRVPTAMSAMPRRNAQTTALADDGVAPPVAGSISTRFGVGFKQWSAVCHVCPLLQWLAMCWCFRTG